MMRAGRPRWRWVLALVLEMLLLWDNKRLLSWDQQPYLENRGRIIIKNSKIASWLRRAERPEEQFKVDGGEVGTAMILIWLGHHANLLSSADWGDAET